MCLSFPVCLLTIQAALHIEKTSAVPGCRCTHLVVQEAHHCATLCLTSRLFSSSPLPPARILGQIACTSAILRAGQSTCISSLNTLRMSCRSIVAHSMSRWRLWLQHAQFNQPVHLPAKGQLQPATTAAPPPLVLHHLHRAQQQNPPVQHWSSLQSNRMTAPQRTRQVKMLRLEWHLQGAKSSPLNLVHLNLQLHLQAVPVQSHRNPSCEVPRSQSSIQRPGLQ